MSETDSSSTIGNSPPGDSVQTEREHPPHRADTSLDHIRPAIPGITADKVDTIEVLLVGTFGGGGIHHYVENLGQWLVGSLDVSTYDMESDPKGNGLRWFIKSFLLSLFALLRFPFRSRPDIVHIHTSQNFSFIRAAPYVFFSSLVWRRPVILHIHGSSFDEFIATDSLLLRWIQRQVFDQSDRIIVLSAYWKDILTQHTSADKLTIVPNAVDVSRFYPTYAAEVPQIVYISSLIERKGITDFIDVITQLLDSNAPDCQVHIAGTGEYESAVTQLSNQYPSVEYHGFISEADKHELLSRGSIFVLPTYAEGLPIALLEGMAGGNAIVTTPVGSIPEVVDEHGAILIEPGDNAAFLTGLEQLLASPERIAEMGSHNRAQVLESYTWERVAEAIGDLYSTVISDSIDEDRGQEPNQATPAAESGTVRTEGS